MKKFFKIFTVLFFVVLFIGTLVFLWNKTRPKVVSYELVDLSRDTIINSIVATGNIEPRDEVLVKPQISGIISEIYCQEGQMIKEGDIIATVKVIPEMGALNSAESRVELSKINLEQAQREHDRVMKLFDTGVITADEQEKSETSVKRANEEFDNSKNNLEIVEKGMTSSSEKTSNTQIRATITGMVLDVPIKVGSSVIHSNSFNDGTTIAIIADLGDMLFVGDVDEIDIGKINEGMEAKITVGALQNISLNANLEYISPKSNVENGVIVFEIKAAVVIPDTVFIRAGYSANATITTDTKEDVLVVPERVVSFDNNKSYVEILTSTAESDEQVFERRYIELGLSNRIMVEVLSGLTGTEKLKGNLKK